MPRFPPSRLVRRLPAQRHVRARLRLRAGIRQTLTIAVHHEETAEPPHERRHARLRTIRPGATSVGNAGGRGFHTAKSDAETYPVRVQTDCDRSCGSRARSASVRYLLRWESSPSGFRLIMYDLDRIMVALEGALLSGTMLDPPRIKTTASCMSAPGIEHCVRRAWFIAPTNPERDGFRRWAAITPTPESRSSFGYPGRRGSGCLRCRPWRTVLS
jgi:hypothetical protein